MASSSLSIFLLLGFIFGSIFALEVTPGSSCATFCLGLEEKDGFDPDASFTSTSEITCKDAEYSSTDMGIKFKACIECLQKSDKVNGTEFDLHWYLYNLRYTISTCLFSIPSEPVDTDIDSPCVIDYACQPLKDPLTNDNLTASSPDTFGYCSNDGGELSRKMLKPCISCLQSSGDQVYLSNFMIALEAGCMQTPEPGGHLSLSGTLFTKDAVNITTPTEDIREKPEGAGTSTMTTGTIVGIAVGCGLLLFGGIALFIVHRRRQKKQKKDEKFDYHGDFAGTPDPLFPPAAKMSASLRSFGDSGNYDKGGNMTMGEYYDKLEEEARTGGRRTYNYDPRAHSRGPSTALPTHQAYLPRTMSRSGLRHEVHADNARRSSPSPPNAVHQHSRSNTNESFALQIYNNSSENSSTSSLPAAAPSRSANVPPPPAGAPPPKVPALVIPSVSKMRMPKQYTPPTVMVQAPSPIDERPIQEISLPLNTLVNNQTRFEDRPLQGGVVYTQHVPESQTRVEQNDTPLRTGKSTLFGGYS